MERVCESSRELVRFLTLWFATEHQPSLLCHHLKKHAAAGLEEVPLAVAVRASHRHKAERALGAMQSLGLCWFPQWRLPAWLVEAQPPSGLFVRGASSLVFEQGLSVVGSRRATKDACAWTAATAQAEAEKGHLIVSGGALGIDAAAHRGALLGGGRTVAFLGTPIDRCYPSAHRPLFAEILRRGGALMSEYPPLAQGSAYAHAQRNRFIAAAGQKVLIVSAARRSGALGTVAFAKRLGREVFVPPRSLETQWQGLTPLLDAGDARFFSSSTG